MSRDSPHLDEMPYSREPLKTLYVAQRLLTTMLLVPFWVLYYACVPRSRRPRPSWSLKQIVSVNFMRRVYRVAEVAGVTWGTRDPDANCDNRTLNETRFEWVEPLPEDLRSGIVVDDQVPFRRVGICVWPKHKPAGNPSHSSASHNLDDSTSLGLEDLEAHAGQTPVIGIFLHGGGYCHMSAHEKSKTSKIPRRLMQDKAFTEIHSVEYRLLQHAPFPAAVQDAAAVYAHLVRRHTYRDSQNQDHIHGTTGSDGHLTNIEYTKSKDSKDSKNNEIHGKNEKQTTGVTTKVTETTTYEKHCKIILIGDSAGGNLVLALARWIRDEARLPAPDGLLLLSPSCDPSHAFPDTPSCYVPRPHAETDYLVDTPEPRALLQRTFLGHNPLETMHSPYVSPASQRVLKAFYGDQFATSVESLTIRALDAEVRANIRNMISVPSTPVLGGELERSPTSLRRPMMASPRGLSLFTDFPRTCVVLGDAERLEREVIKLVGAMERDGVKVRTAWVEDGVHDVLIMGWWDQKVIDKVWTEVEAWVDDVATSRTVAS
ncbi:unnamed protein product [Somion occarium]|uniref:Alpha/beta hydrolase fold-3 domain-containing protein n=1 Tax=Somion occarium TaxID=3059160 RepID=A0ABP1CY62_9APHY